ncbi:MAG: NAD-dependent epimerase/dehydratase family protein [Solirubrobacterales bacterium]
MSARALVTGGSGFIGGRLIESLVGDGRVVRALARSQSSADRVAGLGAEPVRGELGDPESLHAAAAGCELVFHAAAKVEDSGPWAEFERDNVQGTRNVVEACTATGVERLVHVSTEAVLIAGEPLVGVDETAPLRTDSRAPYPRSKALAEEVVLTGAGEGPQRVIVRPRFVWGAGDQTLLPGMVAMVRSGRFAWIGGGGHLTDVTHVDNVVRGLRLVAESGRSGEAYFVTDGDPVVFREFVSELLRTQGVDPPTRSIPTPVAAALASGGELAWRLLPLAGAPPLTRFAFWVSSQECTIDISKARRELGYTPVRTRDEGLAGLREAAA